MADDVVSEYKTTEQAHCQTYAASKHSFTRIPHSLR